MSESRPRGRETVRDMAWSLAVVGIFVVLVAGVVAWQRSAVPNQALRNVDVAGTLAGAAPTAGFPLWQPAGLAAGWRPTSAWSEGPVSSGVGGVVVHLGYLTPQGSYAEFRQTDGNRTLAITNWTGGAVHTGSTTIDGRRWQTWQSPTQRALVLDSGTVTRVVTGKAQWPELQELAGSLVVYRQPRATQPAPSSSS